LSRGGPSTEEHLPFTYLARISAEATAGPSLATGGGHALLDKWPDVSPPLSAIAQILSALVLSFSRVIDSCSVTCGLWR
jgi:hypothetical protein